MNNKEFHSGRPRAGFANAPIAPSRNRGSHQRATARSAGLAALRLLLFAALMIGVVAPSAGAVDVPDHDEVLLGYSRRAVTNAVREALKGMGPLSDIAPDQRLQSIRNGKPEAASADLQIRRNQLFLEGIIRLVGTLDDDPTIVEWREKMRALYPDDILAALCGRLTPELRDQFLADQLGLMESMEHTIKLEESNLDFTRAHHWADGRQAMDLYLTTLRTEFKLTGVDGAVAAFPPADNTAQAVATHADRLRRHLAELHQKVDAPAKLARSNRLAGMEKELDRLEAVPEQRKAAKSYKTSLDTLKTEVADLALKDFPDRVATLRARVRQLQKQRETVLAAAEQSAKPAPVEPVNLAALIEAAHHPLGEPAKAAVEYFNALKANDSKTADSLLLRRPPPRVERSWREIAGTGVVPVDEHIDSDGAVVLFRNPKRSSDLFAIYLFKRNERWLVVPTQWTLFQGADAQRINALNAWVATAKWHVDASSTPSAVVKAYLSATSKRHSAGNLLLTSSLQPWHDGWATGTGRLDELASKVQPIAEKVAGDYAMVIAAVPNQPLLREEVLIFNLTKIQPAGWRIFPTKLDGSWPMHPRVNMSRSPARGSAPEQAANLEQLSAWLTQFCSSHPEMAGGPRRSRGDTMFRTRDLQAKEAFARDNKIAHAALEAQIKNEEPDVKALAESIFGYATSYSRERIWDPDKFTMAVVNHYRQLRNDPRLKSDDAEQQLKARIEVRRLEKNVHDLDAGTLMSLMSQTDLREAISPERLRRSLKVRTWSVCYRRIDEAELTEAQLDAVAEAVGNRVVEALDHNEFQVNDLDSKFGNILFTAEQEVTDPQPTANTHTSLSAANNAHAAPPPASPAPQHAVQKRKTAAESKEAKTPVNSAVVKKVNGAKTLVKKFRGLFGR